METENSKKENVGEDKGTVPLEENNEDKETNLTRIWKKIYDKDTLNRINIERLIQIYLPKIEIRRLLKVSKAFLSK